MFRKFMVFLLVTALLLGMVEFNGLGNLGIKPQVVEAATNSVSILNLDFEGANSPASVLTTYYSSLISLASMDFVSSGKTNQAGASAAGNFARIAQVPGQTVSSQSYMLQGTTSTNAKTRLNTLTPGTWNITFNVDYDIVNRNNVNSPCVALKLIGTDAVTGVTNSVYNVFGSGKYLDNSPTAILGDSMFTHYSVLVPIKVFASADAANQDSSGYTKFVAGAFTTLDFRILNFSSSTDPNTLIVDWDNIKIDAVLEGSQTPEPTPTPTPAPTEDPFTQYLNTETPNIVRDLGESTIDGVVVKKVVYHSRTINGSDENVYAIIARPAAEGSYPGILYLHGGGGYADEANVINWAKNGYIAISLDEPGIADPSKCPNSAGPWKDKAYGADRFLVQPDVTYSSIFSAVVAELKAFNLLASQPGIITNRIGITGISWGGYSATMLAGLLEDRVSAVYSFYGCGYYDKGTVFNNEGLGTMSAADSQIWLQYLDAGRRASKIKAKYFIAAAAKDHYFWPTAVMETLNQIPGYKNQVFSSDLSHSLNGVPGGDTSMTYFNYYLKDSGNPFPVVNVESYALQSDGSKSIIFNVDAATTISGAKLYYSRPSGTWETRIWNYMDAQSLGSNRFMAVLSTEEVSNNAEWYVMASDDRPVSAASRVYWSSSDSQGTVPLAVTNVSLAYVSPRSVKIDWNNSNLSYSTSILRKKQEQSGYVEVAVLNGASTTYTDTDLDPGATYMYKLRSISNLKYSEATAETQITTEAYQDTVLEFLDNQITADKPEDNVEIRATLKDSTGNFLAGRQLDFELQGQYVGTYIDKTIGSAVTDANGQVELDYVPKFQGSYTIKGSFQAEDANFLSAAQSTVALEVYGEKWVNPPVVIKVSDAVKPDSLISINGYGMKSSDMSNIEVKAMLSNGQSSPQPPADASELPIEQTDALNGNFLVARLPGSVVPGIYDIWVKNEYGWCTPIQINIARPLFISENEVFEGLDIEISGRNFDAAEFGAVSNTKVRLNNGQGGIYTLATKNVSPYSIKFTIKNIPLGNYWVEVSNDGGIHWVRLENGQKLSVVAPGPDPLGLGVAWVKDFEWDKVFNVSDYGAVPDDSQDDTSTVAAAVSAAKESGGGVVYFPKGRYDLSRIDLPAEVVLLGEDESNTFLYHNGTTSASMIQSYGDGKTLGHQGVAKLSIRLSNDAYRPDAFLWLGHDWGNGWNNDITKRTAEKIFVYRVNLDYDLTAIGPSGRGLGTVVLAKQKFLFNNNYYKGWFGNLNRVYVNDYFSLHNNYFEFSEGLVVTTTNYTFVENNKIVAHPESLADQHGFFGRGNVHMENNIVENTGNTSNLRNDGEPFCVENVSGFFNMGEVLAASATDITVAPVQTLTDYVVGWEYLAVMIIDGKGLGQYRKVIGRVDNKLTIDKPWDIIPGRSSKFTLISPNDNVTFYRNTIINCAKGIWFYGNAIDCVAADNVSIDSEGIFVYSSEVLSKKRSTPSYFITIKGNEITGVSRRSLHAGISVNSARTDTGGKYYAVSVYGVNIQDNSITGNPSLIPISNTETPPYSGIVSCAAFHSSDVMSDEKTGDTTNLIIENNSLKDIRNGGIVLTKAEYGPVLKGNSFSNVGAQNIYYINGQPANFVETQGEYTDNRAPFFRASSILSVSEIATESLKISWPVADDIFGVAGYKIYVNDVLYDTLAADVNSCNIIGLTPETGYSIVIKAFDAVGNVRSDGLIAIATTSGMPLTEGLSSLQISQGTLNPVFDGSILAYTVNVTSDIESVGIIPGAAHGTITINGSTVESGTSIETALIPEDNIITIVVSEEGKKDKTYTITVKVPTVISISPPAIDTPAGIAPILPDSITVSYSDGTNVSKAVTWDAVTEEQYAAIGSFPVNGILMEKLDKVSITVNVTNPVISSISPISVTTRKKVPPVLPGTMAVEYSDGTTKNLNVTWDEIDKQQYEKEGRFTVNGTVEGTSIKAVVNVTVTNKKPDNKHKH